MKLKFYYNNPNKSQMKDKIYFISQVKGKVNILCKKKYNVKIIAN